MLGWFTPRCPLDTYEKAWVERRMRWLAGRFGAARLRAMTVVEPTDEFFPDPYHGDESGARDLLTRMCGYMGVNPLTVRLRILDDEQVVGAVGLYERERSTISVIRSQLASPGILLATLAHELAHELLLKSGHLTGTEPDHEQVTDLLPVYLGVGIFGANATVSTASYSEGNFHSWSVSKQGYLSSITLGYALALFAYARGEDRPAWAAHLRTDAAATLKAGLTFLRKTGDSLFGPDTVDGPFGPRNPADVIAALADRSPTQRLSALWDVAEYGMPSDKLLPAVERCLKDKDDGVRCEAIRTLGAFGAAAVGAAGHVVETGWHGDAATRAAAADALGGIGSASADVVSALGDWVGAEADDVAAAAAGALARLGPAARAAELKVLAAIEAAAAVTDYDRLDRTLVALRAVVADARGSVNAYFQGRDPEVRDFALRALKGLDG